MLALSPLSHFLWPIIIASLVAAGLGTLFGYFLHGHLNRSQGTDTQSSPSLPDGKLLSRIANLASNAIAPVPAPVPAPIPLSVFIEDPQLGQLYRQQPAAEDIDDLTKAGIDPTAAKQLNQAGIWNFRQLASLTEAGKATLGARFGIHVVNWSWIRARFKNITPSVAVAKVEPTKAASTVE
jgi:hypothetical protein